MRNIWTIFRKEIQDTLRDRRTIITMILFPLLLFPVMMGVVSNIAETQTEKAQQKVLTVALVTNGSRQADGLKALFTGDTDFEIQETVPADSVESRIRRGTLDAAFVFAPNFDRYFEEKRAGTLSMYYKSTDNIRIIQSRLNRRVDDFRNSLLSERFQLLNLDQAIMETVTLNEVNVATEKERFGNIIGGLLPYIFIIFCFLGSMYPAIDLAAGEKERRTLETLLTTPVSRFQIMLGKFGVVALSGLLSAMVSLVGLYVGFRQSSEMTSEFLNSLLIIFAPQSLLLLISLLLPLSIFFAGILLSISLYTKSYKEAQSAISPLVIVAIIPGLIGLIPGVQLDALTALVPILNVALATKQILSGTIDYLLLGEVYLSMIIVAILSLWGASQMFRRESILFRD